MFAKDIYSNARKTVNNRVVVNRMSLYEPDVLIEKNTDVGKKTITFDISIFFILNIEELFMFCLKFLMLIL